MADMTTEHILRVDCLGRVTTTRERRAALLAEFDQSGMSGPKFAKRAGIKYTTFANWLQKRRRQRNRVTPASTSSPDGTSRVRWLEAVVDSPQQIEPPTLATATLVVHGPGGVRLELSDDKQVKLAALLLRELNGRRGC